jgi:hypothetical protein
MNLVSKYIFLLLLLISASFSFSTKLLAADWPTEVLLNVQNDKYGRLCTNCTAVFSHGYCAPTCCGSCQAVATKKGLNIPDSCQGVCQMEQTPTAADEDHIKKCKDSNYALRGCDQLKLYLGNIENEDFRRAFQKRVESCNEAVEDTKGSCLESKLVKAYPADLFNLSQEIVDSPSCDFTKVENYNLKTAQLNPQQVIGQCDDSYNRCKKYCFDENTVYGTIDGQNVNRTNSVGQHSYEDQCKPLYAVFIDKKKIREELIQKANDVVLSCQSGDDDPNDIVDNEDGNNGNEDPVITPDSGKTNPVNPNLAVNNPEVAMSNINGIVSAIQPFLPTNQNNFNPSLYNSVSNSIPTAQRYGLSESEMYGPDYSGWDANDTSDTEYLDTNSFDKPQSLKQSGNRQNQNNNRNSGSGMNALGGSPGNSNQGAANKTGSRGGTRKKSKDKTLFGKSENGSNTYSSSSISPSNKSKNKYGGLSGSGLGARSSLYDSSKKFDASKYHQAIMASYQKGVKSKAQQRAERRAAGLSLESRDEKAMRGYSLWHQENKIHPDNISLFMQTRICYHTKFSSNFRATCEFSRP